jgi:hypothetical protein
MEFSPTIHSSAIALQIAVENSYAVFAPYISLPVDKGSPITVTDKMRLPLETQALRELTKEDLDIFVFKALTTWGNEDDLRHFLPRILELTANQAFWTWLGLYQFFHKFKLANWKMWPQEEQVAIEVYCQALWRYILDLIPVSENIFSSHTNCFLVNLTEILDIQPYLAAWGKSHNEILHLANLVSHYGLPYQDKETAIVYHVEWLKDNQYLSVVRDWLITQEHLETLEIAFFANPSNQLLSMAVDTLFWTFNQKV